MKSFVQLALLVLTVGNGLTQTYGAKIDPEMIFMFENVKPSLEQRVDHLETRLEGLTDALKDLNSKLSQFSSRALPNNDHNEINPSRAIVESLNAISGRFNVTVMNKTIEVLFEQNLYGGDWIVIQHRFDGSVDFYRNWADYRNGFGNFDGEFWLGLENIHLLTSSKSYELLVHLESFAGEVKFARYGKFAIGGQNEGYQLKTLKLHSGTAGDSLEYSIGSGFSTYDHRDNEESQKGNCAVRCHGGWWYKACSASNLNGSYKDRKPPRAMSWFHFDDEHRGLKISKIMIRAV